LVSISFLPLGKPSGRTNILQRGRGLSQWSCDPYNFWHTIRYDTIEEFNVDWKAEYLALSSTRSQKKKQNNQCQCPFNTVQAKIREVSPEGIRVTMEERICERDEF